MNQKFITITDLTIAKSLFKSIFVPRPIAWISSISKDGIHNIAPFSYFNLVADSPLMVMFSVTNYHVEGGYKDTLQNIIDCKHFVINLVTHELFDQMNLTAQELPKNADEFDHAQLSWLKSDNSNVRRVLQSPVNIECEFYQTVELPKTDETLSNIMVIGTVKKIHIAEHILDENQRIDYSKMDLVARMGYDKYLKISSDNLFTRKRK